MFLDAIREGFHIAHRNWQLIPVRIAVSVINLLSLLFFLGIPGFIAVVYLGFDLAYAKEVVPLLIKDPLGVLSKYIGLITLIVIALFMYLTFSSVLHIYAVGGTLGVLRSSAVDRDSRFSLSLFLKAAGENITRLFWLLSIIMAGLVVLVTGFGVLGATGGPFVISLPETGGALQAFTKSFMTLSYIIFGALFLYGWLVFSVFSVMILVAEDTGASAAIKRTYRFLSDRPGAFVFYLLLMAGLVAASFIVLPFTLIPFLVPLVNAVLQNYCALVLWSSLIAYYMRYPGSARFSREFDRKSLPQEVPFTG